MGWYHIFGPDMEKGMILAIFIACYTLALSRRVKIAYASLGGAALLLLFGFLRPGDAIFKAINWDVLGIYWGFMMVSFVFAKSGVPELIANKILVTVKVERYAIVALCAFAAFVSSFMENVGTVLIMAPIAIALANKLNSSLFYYLIAIAISSNVVTTVSMVADPPALVLAMEVGMQFLDFYWFQGKPGLGTLSICGAVVALLTLLIQFRGMNKRIDIIPEKVSISKAASVLFALGVVALAIGPRFGLRPGIVGLIVGLIALYLGRNDLKEMVVRFDWNSFLFIIGVFMVIFTVDNAGLLKDFAEIISRTALKNPFLMLAFLTWISVALSSFIDNVPFTILMIPVCQNIAGFLGVSQWPLLYGMLVGTGIGGNITPVGATANVFACGILEKHGYKIKLKDYLTIGAPFSVAAVAVVHILLSFIWMP